jgi:hypothetical protein
METGTAAEAEALAAVCCSRSTMGLFIAIHSNDFFKILYIFYDIYTEYLL